MGSNLKLLMGLVILGFLLSGCGTIYKVARDERNVGTQMKDEQITMAIREKFVDDKAVEYFNISTYCYKGNVYLVGEYENLNQKKRAIALAREVDGVKSVTDHFLPEKKGDLCGSTDNLTLGVKVKAKLIGDKDIESTNIEVKTVQCHVILLGLVDETREIKGAVAHAKSVEGVRSVTSYLKVEK
jgi:hyperosmotically inducible protein